MIRRRIERLEAKLGSNPEAGASNRFVNILRVLNAQRDGEPLDQFDPAILDQWRQWNAESEANWNAMNPFRRAEIRLACEAAADRAIRELHWMNNNDPQAA
jgi:hypothetical protein